VGRRTEQLSYKITCAVKRSIAAIGSRCSATTLFALDGVLNQLSLGFWMKSHGMWPSFIFESREQLFDWVAESIKNRDVLYLEFGVHRGQQMHALSRLLLNKSSHLHGFDSFEGLPESWGPLFKRGTFSTGGVLPATTDPRVTYFKGWFEDTLPNYVPPPHDVLFINIDADLYSSTRTVLKYLRSYVRQGTYLFFDEFHHREHEMKAFDEFLEDTGYQFELLAGTKPMDQVLFRRTR
jgi:hypothetical protein